MVEEKELYFGSVILTCPGRLIITLYFIESTYWRHCRQQMSHRIFPVFLLLVILKMIIGSNSAFNNNHIAFATLMCNHQTGNVLLMQHYTEYNNVSAILYYIGVPYIFNQHFLPNIATCLYTRRLFSSFIFFWDFHVPESSTIMVLYL